MVLFVLYSGVLPAINRQDKVYTRLLSLSIQNRNILLYAGAYIVFHTASLNFASISSAIYCHFKNSSSVIALFNITPTILPVDIAYDTARKGLVLSPQANILSTVVF